MLYEICLDCAQAVTLLLHKTYSAAARSAKEGVTHLSAALLEFVRRDHDIMEESEVK